MHIEKCNKIDRSIHEACKYISLETKLGLQIFRFAIHTHKAVENKNNFGTHNCKIKEKRRRDEKRKGKAVGQEW